jgi:cytochrome c oxidase subunit II
VTTTAAVNGAFAYIMAFCILLFAGILFFTVLLPIRYRRSRNPTPARIDGNWIAEGAFILASLLAALTMFLYGYTSFTFLKTAPADAMKVTVVARQWSWIFQYDNNRKSPSLVVPQGKDVDLVLTSPDVIHGFFVPAYRIKQDAVPGMKTHIWFKADQLGSVDVLCTQYCGLQHSKMRSKIYVVPPADYEKWYRGEEVEIPGMNE